MTSKASDTGTAMAVLKKAPLWSGLSDGELRALARSFKELKYPTGHVIVHKGDRGVGFYLIADGSVEVRSDGRVLAKLGPGQYFGEMALLDGQPRNADVVALEPSRCLVLSAWAFKGIVSSRPKIALALLQESVRRLNMNVQTLASSETRQTPQTAS